MSSSVDAYVDGLDPAVGETITALDEAVRGAYAGFDVAVKYRLLMYAIDADWRHWVCAIGSSTKAVQLRFLFGVLLDDPRDVLRPGSSTLMSWDLTPGQPVDAASVGAYVTQAVAVYPTFRADAQGISDRAKAAAVAAGRRPRT